MDATPGPPLPNTLLPMASHAAVRACPCCGLEQTVPTIPSGCRALCPRCRSVVGRAHDPRARSRVVALASAALVLYPAAMVLPVLEIERLGHRSAATIWSGALELLREGSVAVGVIVLVCSIIIPAIKLIDILLLCTRLEWFERHHRAATYHAVEWLGRWGMVDVLLVAVLVAAVKLGSWVQVSPGPGAAAFATVVVLSMLASAVFDPAQIWEEHA